MEKKKTTQSERSPQQLCSLSPWWLDALGVLAVKPESCSDPSSHVRGSKAETYQQQRKNKKQNTKKHPLPEKQNLFD